MSNEYKNPIDALFDEENCDPIILFNEKGEEVINFGKYKGQLAEVVLKKDPGYFGWITQAEFPLTTKQAFTRIMLKSKM